MTSITQKITPFLWFDDQAEEAAKFYISVFGNGKILEIQRYIVDTPSNKPMGSVMTVAFEIVGMQFTAINGGPFFKFNESVSFVVRCETQEEVDQLWEKLSADPKSEQCGWLKDKYGLSWQIVPTALLEMNSDPDPKKAQQVMQKMMQMKKLDIAKLREAYQGK